MEPPETRYAKSGDLHIAYQVVGEGPALVVSDQWFGNVDAQWEFPPMRRLLQRLASFARLVLFDKRGTGLSDPVPMRTAPTLEEWMDDLRAVLDAAGIDRAAVLCGVGATYMGVLFAATYPERITSLVVVNGYARMARTPDYPWGRSQKEIGDYVERVQRGWGKSATLEFLAPSVAEDEEIRRTHGRYERAWASPGAYASLTSVREENDVRHVLPAIRVPTLIIHRSDSRFAPRDGGRYLAGKIPGAR
jgi:pimeloyl-ACP methyl ester carboxylesterase